MFRVTSLLPKNVESYRQFELLILDDCSPDNTLDVARSFNGPHLKFIRNEKNLGHLKTTTPGRYMWLNSADDRLRNPFVLERYLGIRRQTLTSHDELVGGRCACQRGRLASHFRVNGVLCVV
ncbi:glycosyltransferase [Bradyrhizobium sp. 38]|nr:glycosyltransferase [Bradyrhizobium sp. 38]MCK1776830.1 glycosyltransferase [Bradyrhizobium sp. 132]